VNDEVTGSIPVNGSTNIQPHTRTRLQTGYNMRMVNPKKPRTPCLNCGKEPYRSFYKYCSNLCQRSSEHRNYIQKWQRGEISGLSTIGTVSRNIKNYLREKYSNKCCVCGWAEINQTTGQVPLVADHIDGNWRNNKEENLRLICPNCDSLTATYAALNKGKGRAGRALSKRTEDARFMLKLRKSNL
jgi:hypothetical protein